MKSIKVIRKLKIYVGCGIKDVPQEFLGMIAQLKEVLAEYDFIEVLKFVPPGETKEGMPRELYVYFNDIHNCVKVADYMIGDLTYNSFGLGWEMGTACEKRGIPMIMCHKEEATPSGIAIGASIANENILMLSYKESILEKECLETLIAKLENYGKAGGYFIEE
jgi:hypothetical protein